MAVICYAAIGFNQSTVAPRVPARRERGSVKESAISDLDIGIGDDDVVCIVALKPVYQIILTSSIALRSKILKRSADLR